MIKLIVGPVGVGKTKQIIKKANEDVKKSKGHLVYIDNKKIRMLELDSKIRFINAGEYNIKNQETFLGFICGIIASNYDIGTIYIDGLYRITQMDLNKMESFFRQLDVLELKYNIDFVLTISFNKEDLPKFLKKYIVVQLKE